MSPFDRDRMCVPAFAPRRTLCVLMLTLALPALVCGSAACAQNGFKLLNEKEIRARVVGKDIIVDPVIRDGRIASYGTILNSRLIDFPLQSRFETTAKFETGGHHGKTQSFDP